MEQEITERIKRLALPKLPPINLAAEQYLVRGRKLQELEDICRDIQENLAALRHSRYEKHELLRKVKQIACHKNQQSAEAVRQSKSDGKHLIWWKRQARLMDIDKRVVAEVDGSGADKSDIGELQIRRAPPVKQAQLQKAQMQCLSRALRLMDDREKRTILKDRIRDYESSRCSSVRTQST